MSQSHFKAGFHYNKRASITVQRTPTAKAEAEAPRSEDAQNTRKSAMTSRTNVFIFVMPVLVPMLMLSEHAPL